MEERQFLLTLLRAGLTSFDEGVFVPESVDWDALIAEADRQGVCVLASDGLQKLYDSGLYTVCGDKESRRVRARWFGKTIQYEQRYTEQLLAAKKMGQWLASAGIQTVVMKGLTVAECYPIPSHRYSADLDCFLIKDGEHIITFEQGNQVMEAHGLKVGRGFYKNSSFCVDGLFVENHKFCTPCRGNKTLINLERLLQRTMLNGPLTRLGDSGLFVPPPMFSALFLIEHAYSHFLHEGLNLRHILDWAVFRHWHMDDVDWPSIESYCAEFGFSRFLESIDHIGEYVLGGRTQDDLSPMDLRMYDSIWDGLDLHSNLDPHSLRAKIAFAGNTIRSAWKYRAYSNISMLRALWIQVSGVVFARKVEL